MRTAFLFALLFGAITMSDVATADEKEEKKEEKKTHTEGGFTFDEKVTVKVWDEQGKKFLNPVGNLWAVRKERKDAGRTVLVFAVLGNASNTLPTDGSLIIDKAGNEYVVTENGGNYFGLIVKLQKAAPKKP
jgi:hypothetical protein